VDQGQQLAAWPVRASPLAQIDQRIGGLLDPEPLGEGGGQEQASVGDGVGVIKGDVELVEGVGGLHRESALLVGDTAAVAGAILPGQRAFLIIGPAPLPLLKRCTQAKQQVQVRVLPGHTVVGEERRSG
jgi:hypothetical protein